MFPRTRDDPGYLRIYFWRAHDDQLYLSGGLQADLPPKFDAKVREFPNVFPARLQEYHDLLTNNQLWLERTKGVAVLSLENAIAYGATGPVLYAVAVGVGHP